MTRRRAPRPLESAIQSTLESVRPRTPLAAVQAVWDEAAGAAIAAEAVPVGEKEGTVTVACRSATWAEQLDLLQSELLERLKSALPEGIEVSRLRFRVETDAF